MCRLTKKHQKYRLSRRDGERFSDLAALEALSKATPDELKELERLDRKRTRLANKDPETQKYLRRHRNWLRRVKRLADKLQKIIDKTKT